jgi:hypothetical protein
MKDAYGNPTPPGLVGLTKKELDDLPEYSLSIPTGVFLGKKWKRNVNVGTKDGPLWVMGEYTEHPNPELCGIVFKTVVIVGDALPPLPTPG